MLARLLRELLHPYVLECASSGISWNGGSEGDVRRCSQPQPSDEVENLGRNAQVYDLSLASLLPPETKQKSMLNANIVTLTSSEYRDMHVIEGSLEPSRERNPMMTEKDAIELDDDENVFEVGIEQA